MEHLYHFDLTQDPFQNEPDLRFYFESQTHRRSALRIDRSLRQSKGLTILTGEAGTGKSLLARRIFEELEEEIFEAALMVMMQGTADASSVLRRFAAQLGVDQPAPERPALLAQIYDHLAIVREDGRHAVLILDDAHVLSCDAMAEIGGLLNFEYEDRRLVSLLLVGMPELDATVAGVPALGQRIDVRVPLQPLAEADAIAYLQHRVSCANGNPALFEPAALGALYKLAGGRPRHMNTLADNSIFEAYLAGRQQVGAFDVQTAAADLGLDPVEDIVVLQTPDDLAPELMMPPAEPAPEPMMPPADPVFAPAAALPPLAVDTSGIEAAVAQSEFPPEPEELSFATPVPSDASSASEAQPDDALLMLEEFPAARSPIDEDEQADELGALLETDASNAATQLQLDPDPELGSELDLGDALDSDLFVDTPFSPEQTVVVMPPSDTPEEPQAETPEAALLSADTEYLADESDAEEIDNLFVELIED